MHQCIYLCANEPGTSYYECAQYNTFREATRHHDYSPNTNTTMIPVCRFVPLFFHNAILRHKLARLFIRVSSRK